jgi:hypothetical protein
MGNYVEQIGRGLITLISVWTEENQEEANLSHNK